MVKYAKNKIFGIVCCTENFLNSKLFQKKKKLKDLEKESGAAGTRTHGRGSVPLMSKSDAIPLHHEAETFDMGKTIKYIVTVCSNSNPIYM